MSFEATVLDTILLSVRDIIDQDSTPRNACLGPVLDANAVTVAVLNLGRRGTSIKETLRWWLVAFGRDSLRAVTQAIPLCAILYNGVN